MKYKFKAINLNGDIFEDFYIANDEEEVVQMIKSKNFFVLSVEEDYRVNLDYLLNNRRIKLKDLALFSKLFYTMLNSGINISKSLKIISEDITNTKLKSAIININEDIHSGTSLSNAMERQKNIFPSLYVEMVRAGEISGNLEGIILRLGDYYDNQNKIKNKINSSLIYPILLIFVSMVVVIFMIVFVLPIFYDIFSSRELILPLTTRTLINFSSFYYQHWSKIIIFIIILSFALKLFSKTHSGKTILDNLKLRTPLIKGLYIKIVTSNLTKTLSILLSAGIPLMKSLEMASNVVNNVIIRQKLIHEISNIEDGKLLSDAIKDIEVFSSVVYSMVKVGEETGALDNMLLKISTLYDEEVRTSFEKLTKLIEPMLMIIVGLIVGFIVISLALPMFDIMYSI